MTYELPANIDSEKAVIGSILVNREAIIAVADSLKPEHFHLGRHAQIYAAALACYTARIPPDLITLSEELRRRGQLDDIGGREYLLALTDVPPTSFHIGYYATNVVKAAMRRRLLAVIGQLGALAYNEAEDIGSVLERAHELIDGASIALHDPRYKPISAAALDKADLPPMSWAIPGLLPQGLTLLIGKPKMKKSWLALGLAIAVSCGGRALGSIPVEQGDVLYLALEDSDRRLQLRQRKILSGAAAPARLQYLTVAPRLDEGLIGTVEGWLRRHTDARLIIIDVLAKVRPKTSGRGNMYDEDYAAIGPLQQLAQRRNISILVIHHMNRSDATDSYDQINGSNGVGGASDGLLALVYERGQTDATLTISSRELEDESSLALRWDAVTAQWILLGKAEDVKASTERQEVIKLLREERRPMTPREVADALGREGKDYQNTKQLMYRMAKEGELSNANGRYTVPALTLLAGRSTASGDPVIDGDPRPITGVSGSRTPQTDSGDRGDRGYTQQKLDHRDHRSPEGHSGAFGSEVAGDPDRITADHRDLLAALPPQLRMTTRMMLASDLEANQELARERCAQYGIDFARARAAARERPA